MLKFHASNLLLKLQASNLNYLLQTYPGEAYQGHSYEQYQGAGHLKNAFKNT